jgi:hypothetical protein
MSGRASESASHHVLFLRVVFAVRQTNNAFSVLAPGTNEHADA